MKTLFLINKSRRDEGPADAVIDQMRHIVQEAGIDCTLVLSASKEESEGAISRAMDDGLEALWIGGGDGTLNHALNFTFGQPVSYGIVPMGTVNALARALGLPPDPVEAVKYLLTAKPVPMDVGLLIHPNGEHYFFTYATVGIHAALFHNIDKNLKRRWGQLAFWESAIRTVWQKSRLPRFTMEMKLVNADDAMTTGRQTAAGNLRDYGYSFTLSNLANYAGYGTFTGDPAASPGFFDLHHFRRNKILPMLASFARLRIFGRDVSRPESGSLVRQVSWVKVRARRKLSVQVDGEPLQPRDRRQFEFTCVNNGVRILLQPVDALALTGEESPENPAGEF